MFGGAIEFPDFLAASQRSVNGKRTKDYLIHGRRNQGWSSTSVPGDIVNYLDTSQARCNPVVLGTTYYLRSSSVQDGPGGTGALTVRIVYLDANGDMQKVDVATNGTTGVNLGAGFSYIQWMSVLTAGSSGAAVGNLTISTVAGAPTVAQTVEYIQALETRSRSGRFKIPRAHTGYLHTWVAASIGGANQDMSIEATVSEYDGDLTSVFRPMGNAYLANNISSPNLELHWRSVPALGEIRLTSIPTATGAGNRADAAFSLLLVTD